MPIAKNVAKGEKIVRMIVGAILIIWGFFITGFWKPISIVVGVFLLMTAFVGY